MSDLFDYDAELRLHNELFRAAARVGSRDRVVDIGGGTRLRATLAAHHTDGGVYFDSRAWIVTARRN